MAEETKKVEEVVEETATPQTEATETAKEVVETVVEEKEFDWLVSNMKITSPSFQLCNNRVPIKTMLLQKG